MHTKTIQQHTPGPWSLDETHLSIASADGLRAIASVAIPGEYGLSKASDCATADANARLIAAAPDMLEALRELFDDVHCGRMVCKDNATLVRIRAAIVKATGAL